MFIVIPKRSLCDTLLSPQCNLSRGILKGEVPSVNWRLPVSCYNRCASPYDRRQSLSGRDDVSPQSSALLREAANSLTRETNLETGIAPRSSSVRRRTETVSLSTSRSPTMSI